MAVKISIKIIGVHSHSEGYPNVRYRIKALRASTQLNISEYSAPLWKTRYAGHNGWFSVLYTLLKAIFSHIKVYLHLLFQNEHKILYVPYPGIFVVYLMLLLPKSRKPNKILLDAFISIYDTVVHDRKLLKKENLLARILKHVESTAFNLATYTISDTPQNSEFYARLFNLPLSKFVDIPLSTNELDYHPSKNIHSISGKKIQVLFFGTLVPLHGIDIIMRAAYQLRSDINIHFRIIGNGQERKIVEEHIKGLNNVTWLQDWQSPQALNREIQASDICLGIFGNTDKTNRVCPYKLYSYAQCGKAIITAETPCINGLNARTPRPWLYTVAADDSDALASAIRILSNKYNKRVEFSKRSKLFYKKNLSNTIANQQLFNLIARSDLG